MSAPTTGFRSLLKPDGQGVGPGEREGRSGAAECASTELRERYQSEHALKVRRREFGFENPNSGVTA